MKIMNLCWCRWEIVNFPCLYLLHVYFGIVLWSIQCITRLTVSFFKSERIETAFDKCCSFFSSYELVEHGENVMRGDVDVGFGHGDADDVEVWKCCSHRWCFLWGEMYTDTNAFHVAFALCCCARAETLCCFSHLAPLSRPKATHSVWIYQIERDVIPQPSSLTAATVHHWFISSEAAHTHTLLMFSMYSCYISVNYYFFFII